MSVRAVGLGLLACVFAAVTIPAQEKEDRTLLSHDQMRSIINEASGERAMHTILELVPYQRVRPASEYGGDFRESAVMARMAKEYGFTNVRVETFPSGPQWQPSVGELWMTTPTSRKLYDIHDVALALGQGTPTGDVNGELIDVGAGRAQDLEGKDLTGKVLLSSSGLGIFNQAAQLGRGQKITIRSIVKADMVPSKAEVVHAEIAGDGSTTQEVAVSGHLYEGVIKQGANDDNSGCALTLEIGRAYLKLVNEGKLPKPKRTINFQWGAEISGTNAWLNAHPEKEKVIVGDLNFDMEGIRIARLTHFRPTSTTWRRA
jgi:aminopeptidase YwaD